MSGLEQLFRWMHVFVGIIWLGLLYYFNFVHGQFLATLDGDAKKKVIPELLPRALFWFRWGAALTWITGVFLLAIVFYHGGLLFEDSLFGGAGWNAASITMLLVVFLAVFLYEALFKSPLGQNKPLSITIGFGLIGIILALMVYWADFSYRGYIIHTGAMFGTIMAFNVWFRIWPAQQKIVVAIKNGEPPDAGLVALAGMRSRHNTYLSLPLLWAMLDAHTFYFAGGNLGLPEDSGWITMLVVILLSWHIVWHCYRRAGKVKGF